MARRRGVLFVAGAACAGVLACAAQAQQPQAQQPHGEKPQSPQQQAPQPQAPEPDELTRLLREVTRLQGEGKYRAAAPLAEQAVALARERHGEEHLTYAGALFMLGAAYRALDRYAEAERLYEQSLAIAQKVLGDEHEQVAHLLNSLATLYESQRRSAEAERLYRRSLDIMEKVRGLEHPDLSRPLNNLAILYQRQGRYSEAERLYQRSRAILEKALGPEHLRVASPLTNLGLLHQAQKRYAEAAPLHKRSLDVTEKALGPEHPDVSRPAHNLAMAYQKQGRAAEAEPLFRRSLDILEKALGPEHHRVASPLRNLAILAQGEGRYAEAQSLYARSLAILEKALGPRHPEVGEALSHLAGLAFAQGDWAGATGYWRRSIDIITQRAAKGSSACGQEASGSEAQRRASRFRGLVKAAHRLSAQDTAAAKDMFRMAQWMQASQAAASLAQMAARLAKGSSELARLVRERQDLVGECSEKDRLLIAAKGKPPAERRAEAEAALAERLTAIDLRLAAIDLQLAKGFPDYAAMASPAPASVTEVQAQLRADEALVLVLGTPAWKPLPEESFIWVVTRSQIRWVRTGLGTKALTESVAALRCGLDKALWNDGAKSERCVQMLGAYRYDAGPLQNVLPFDLERAHTLYKALLGPAEDLLAAKHLLVVAPGPLSTLPFHVLVAEPPKTALPADPAGYRDVAWLGTRQPITVLPAVASLKALRQHAKASRAGRAYLGIGNPLLDGSADKDHTRLARSAHNWQRCSAVPSRWQLVASALDGRLPNLRAMLPARHADIEYVRRQVPLPETAFELCETARDLGMPESEVLLGGQATETAVKDLSEKGVLATYRVVHFATHGALAGEVKGPSETEPAEEAREMSEPDSPDEPEPIATADSLAEPGLLLTPPPAGTSDATLLDRDDGFLTASEIAGLKLDAEWVVLSACNTAGTAGAGAEALSGLAKAFFYAGARSLLVSHWGVSSYAAVKLTTRAFQELEADRSVGRAEVLRRSMRDLIETGSPLDAHPMTWAAFVVVGEGAR